MNTSTQATPGTSAPGDLPPPVGRQETIEALLTGYRREGVPIRKTFVQQGKGAETKPGPLASFLTKRDERALDAYLLVHALASASPWSCEFPSGFWVRALGLLDGRDIDAGRGTVSKIMKRLVDRKLILRSRSERKASITLLREDGSGEPYEHPHETKEHWLHLPHAYWFDSHYTTLTLRAKVMLLIALERPDNFYLPQKQAPSWYGVSADSADRGLRELRNVGLLSRKQEPVLAPRSDTGWTIRDTYTLTGAFSSQARRKASNGFQPSAVEGLDEGTA